MSESHAINQSIQEPQAVYLKDYQVPVYLIDEIDLQVDLYDEETRVKSHMRVRHNRLSTSKIRDLVLNGEELTLVSVKLNGTLLSTSQYQITEQSLTIPNVPDNFDLEIETKITHKKILH